MKNLLSFILTLTVLFLFTNCTNDESIQNPSEEKGSLRLKITDAPIDNVDIKSCFLTISGLKLDGNMVSGFQKTTVNLLAFQKGDTYTIGNFEVNADNYSDLTLVLAHETSAAGNMPGCYIEEKDGAIHALTSTDLEIKLNYDFELEEKTEHEILLDMDLRKSIRENQSSGESKYSFVTDSELESAVRIIKEDSGVIKGNCQDLISGSDEIIVYAYAKGTYDAMSEMTGQGQSNIMFKKAVNSAMLDNDGDFEIHFLNEGEYELHFMSYEINEAGSLQLSGSLMVEALDILDPLVLNLSGAAELTVNVTVTDVILL